MRSLAFLFLFLLPCLLTAQQKVSFLEMDLSEVYQEYGAVKKGLTVTGEPYVTGGDKADNVIGLHALSRMRLFLSGDALRFQAGFGVSSSSLKDKKVYSSLDGVPLADGSRLVFEDAGDDRIFKGIVGADGTVAQGSVYLEINLDGKQAFAETLTGGGSLSNIDLDLSGAEFMEIIISPGEDGASGDEVVIFNPEVTYRSVRPCFVDIDSSMVSSFQSGAVKDILKNKISGLPVMDIPVSVKTDFDWLINPEKTVSGIYRTPDSKGIVLANSMVSRTFRLFPNLATVDFVNRMTGESMLRAVSPEGYVWIDGKKWSIGGLAGQPERAYLDNGWLDRLHVCPDSFVLEDFYVQPFESKVSWKKYRWCLNDRMPSGKEIVFVLRRNPNDSLVLKLHYAVLDNIPVLHKWFELENNSDRIFNVDGFCLEYLSMSEPESPVGGDPAGFRLPDIHVESDFAFGGFTEKESDHTEYWVADPEYTSQRNYGLQTPCILNVKPPIGPDQSVGPGSSFETFGLYEMPFDSDDRERKGLFTRNFYRTVAPWTTENPIFMHLTSSDPNVVRTAVDQCAETGYEMIILSFGSGADAENISEENIRKYKDIVEYGMSKGIEIGCYSLLASRWISDEVDVINPLTGKRGGMTFGSSPCLCSEWGYEYFNKIKTFFERTGMKCFEHDGSYPGDVCASVSHKYHKGLGDSQWNQYKKITEFYRWMRSKGIYMNVPDFYFLNGSNKTGIGYREENWSLPRDRQIIHTRQLNYDCTWERPGSALWSFVPLVEYHGGGAAATLEPLSDHLHEYKTLMFQNYAAGVQACYRGTRLYDTPETKEAVCEIISWYRKYRRILNSDIIHLRKPDVRDWDGFMHVDPDGAEKGLAVFFNPTDEDITRHIELPLYYTGLKGVAKIREKEGRAYRCRLDPDCNVDLSVSIPAGGYTWYVIE